MRNAIIAVDHRNVIVKCWPTNDNRIIVEPIRDAGAHKSYFPGFEWTNEEEWHDDRIRNLMGTNIRTKWAMKGWAIITKDVFDTLLVAVL